MSSDREEYQDDDGFAWIRQLREALTLKWGDLHTIAERAESLARRARSAGTPALAREAEGIGQDLRQAVSGLWDLTLLVSRHLRERQEKPTLLGRPAKPPESDGSEG